jgi:hypothetical protein
VLSLFSTPLRALDNSQVWACGESVTDCYYGAAKTGDTGPLAPDDQSVHHERMSSIYRLSGFTGAGIGSRIEIVVKLEETPQADVKETTLIQAANEAVFKRWHKLNPRRSPTFTWPLSFSIEDFPTCDVNTLTPGIPEFTASSGAKVWITKPTWGLEPEKGGYGAW